MSLTLTESVLERYRRSIFVETGTFMGGGIDVAKAVGIPRIASIEVYEPYWREQSARFAGDSGVKIVLGDSATVLGPLIADMDDPIVFWLDGHVHFGNRGKDNSPILDELAQIARHRRCDHVVMVDDRQAMGTDLWGGVTEADVVAGLMAINPSYRLVHEDNRIVPAGILVAVPS